MLLRCYVLINQTVLIFGTTPFTHNIQAYILLAFCVCTISVSILRYFVATQWIAFEQRLIDNAFHLDNNSCGGSAFWCFIGQEEKAWFGFRVCWQGDVSNNCCIKIIGDLNFTSPSKMCTTHFYYIRLRMRLSPIWRKNNGFMIQAVCIWCRLITNQWTDKPNWYWWIIFVSDELCQPLNCKKRELCLLEDPFTAVCVPKTALHKNR